MATITLYYVMCPKGHLRQSWQAAEAANGTPAGDDGGASGRAPTAHGAAGGWPTLGKRAQPRAPEPGVPLVAFALKPEKLDHGYTEFDVADRLRQTGWVVPVRGGRPGDRMPARHHQRALCSGLLLTGVPCCAAREGP
jgi:hypothetical protein